jgi:hypothetical protein
MMARHKVSPWVEKLERWRDDKGYNSWEQFLDKTECPYSRSLFSGWQLGKAEPSVEAVYIVSSCMGMDAATIAYWLESEGARRDERFRSEAVFYLRMLKSASPHAEVLALLEQLTPQERQIAMNMIKGLINGRQANI